MKRVLLGIIVGVLITILSQFGYRYWSSMRVKDNLRLFEMGKIVVERSIPGAKVLDVVIYPNHKEYVNYIYDKMYGIEVRYNKDNNIKMIMFPISKYKDTWINPNNTQMFILDDKAEKIYSQNRK